MRIIPDLMMNPIQKQFCCKLTKKWRVSIFVFLVFSVISGCAGQSKPVQKITKPVDQTAAELVKVREFKSESGETRAVVSPADQKQLKITF